MKSFQKNGKKSPHVLPTNSHKLMTIINPYVETLVEMGYDRADCEMVAAAGVDKTFPLNIHGRVFNTEKEYKDALADFLNGI